MEPPPVNTARRTISSLATATLVIALAACQGVAPATAGTPTAATSASSPATPSAVASGSSQPTAQPTADLGDFSCDFPVKGKASVQRAQLVDVRVGTHAGYDRVVFEFASGVPAFTLKEATPPLLEDASGRELDVEGSAFWQLVMPDASRVDLKGNAVLTKTDFTPGFPKLAELIEGGDFEAVSTWYFGLTGDACVRLLSLHDPSRLVFDIEH
jgi:hypothetical protein